MKTKKIYYTEDSLMSPQLSILEGFRTLVAETDEFPVYLESRRTAGLVAAPKLEQGQLVLPFCPNFWAAQFSAQSLYPTLVEYLDAAIFCASSYLNAAKFEERLHVSVYDFARWKRFADNLTVDNIVFVESEDLRLDAAHAKVMGKFDTVEDENGNFELVKNNLTRAASLAIWIGQPAFFSFEAAFRNLETKREQTDSIEKARALVDRAPAEYTFISF